MNRVFIWCLAFMLSVTYVKAAETPSKKVLILVEGEYNLSSIPSAHGRQLAQLLGHFKTAVSIQGMASYKPHQLDTYDYVFVVGETPKFEVSGVFEQDLINDTKPIIWINSGFEGFCRKYGIEAKYGFKVGSYETRIPFTSVRSGKMEFSKGTPEIYSIQIKDKKKVSVWATAYSGKIRKEVPYMVNSGNLTYVADMPFINATETDRYLFFSDKLHDILHENHAESKRAILRIEDVTPLNNPDKLREVADILSERGIPFLVGVVPIYYNPGEDRRVTLTDRPEVVDALKYMVRNGGSIVMHGVTHQYKGVSTDDFEFWNGQDSKPISDENSEDIAKKLELGIDEFFKNGLYPVAWETPHYGASVKAYQVFSKYFSTSVEQKMVIDNFDYGQYFPFEIEKDIYGQKVYPENLGYVPLNSNPDSSRAYVKRIIKNTESISHVRDGIVSCFFHPFLDLELLKELADGIKSKGYTFIDLSHDANWVRARNKIILTGNQTYNLTLNNSYLHEIYTDEKGNIVKKSSSPQRFQGNITRSISLNPGQVYVAEGIDYFLKEPSFKDKVMQKFRTTYEDLFADKNWHQARALILWNQWARGAAYMDQSSMAAMLKSVNISVDTLFLGEDLKLDKYNLLIVPYSYVDSLTYFDNTEIIRFVKKGGNLITDRKNKLITKFGFKFLPTEMKLHQIRDKYYPSELIVWKYSQLAYKFEYDLKDEIFCEDASTELPVAIGRSYGDGKVIYFNTAFDPYSYEGYSNYPYALDYIKRFFKLSPVFKRENLEFYFEPSMRKNTSTENIVKQWVKQGIRVVHIGGWHQYPSWTYDYARLIKVAHDNGILVYAWLEPPQVSEKFWKEHPEWREKNYKGQDVRPSWRYPVAMSDEKCLKAIMDNYLNLLKEFDWDGVNLAELYFEAGLGFNEPEKFSPMHPSAVAEFKKLYGFDMRQIFDSASCNYWKRNKKAKDEVVAYRINKIRSLHEKFLSVLTNFAKSKRDGFGVMVTFMDTYFSPEIIENHGVSSDNMLDLQKKFNVLLQPEDPQNKWSSDPERYAAFGKHYAEKMSDPSKLLVDLNILSFRTREEITPFPTLVQTGIESYHLIHSAASGAPRFTIYSEGSCNPQDVTLFSFASSSQVKYKYTDNGYHVSSPYSFVLQLPKDIRIIEVDNQSVVGYRENDFVIPAGEHDIVLHDNDIPGFSTVQIQPQILSCTGNLLSISYGMRKISFSYESYERNLISLNREPTAVKIDGKDQPFESLKGNDCFTLKLPSGKHEIEVTTGDKFTYGINLTSLWSIGAIAIYGTFAVVLLLIMYFGLKIFRRKLEN